jgi:hypothetical protein
MELLTRRVLRPFLCSLQPLSTIKRLMKPNSGSNTNGTTATARNASTEA